MRDQVEEPVKPSIGGLMTRMPAVSIPKGFSPDLRNVVIRDGTMQKRGGIVPLFRDRMLGDCVRNVSWRATSRLSDISPTDGDFVISPGHMVAGHRSVYDGEPELTIALWFSPERLISQHGGNGQSSASAAYNPAPFTVRVLPIISKGPVKKSDNISGVTAANLWGTHTNAGMPFCIYLFNNGTASAPIWLLCLSAHVLIAGVWTLQTIASSVEIVEGLQYHIIAAVSNSRVALRVGIVRVDEEPVYKEDQTLFSGQLASNKCPIQVFDCPKQFVQATTVGTATQRPGLGYTTAASGGYWYASVRPDGRIDDISIWIGDRTLSTMERRTRVEASGQTDLANLWSFTGEAIDYVREETGRGNHLFFVPRGPVSVGDDGGKEGGSWFFNGVTSYALMDTDRPAWRWYNRNVVLADSGTATGVTSATMTDASKAWVVNQWVGFYVDIGGRYGYVTSNTATVLTFGGWVGGVPAAGAYAIFQVSVQPGPMWALVRDNMAHGLHAEFWVDSIEPEYEQVVAEIHSVLKLSISNTGRIVGYCRDGGVSAIATTLTQIGGNYQGPITSNTTAVPGRRYSVTLMRRDGGAAMDLYIDNVLEVSLTGLNPANYAVSAVDGNSHVPGALTVGFGSSARLIRGVAPADIGIASSNLVNTEPTSGFVGRVETLSIVTSPNAATLISRHGPEGIEQWAFKETRVWTNPVGPSRLVLAAAQENDLARNVGRGAIAKLATQVSAGFPVAQVADSTSTGAYALASETMFPSPVEGEEGHAQLYSVGARILYALCYYRFDVDDLDRQYSGAYNLGFERLYSNGAVGPLWADHERHPRKHTHLQISDTQDAVGLLGGVWRCCGEGDWQTSLPLQEFVAQGWYTSRQRPYTVRSPRELGLQWTQGMVLPPLGSTPVTLIADYDVQTEGRRFMVVGSGRSIYHAKQLWDDGAPLLLGGKGSYILARTNPAAEPQLVGVTPKTTVQFSCWLRPLRLDGVRMVAAKRINVTDAALNVFSDIINWMVLVDNGSLVVLGTESTDRVWRYVEGSITGAPPQPSRTSSMRAGVWNHLCVQMGPTAVRAWINGQEVSMVSTAALSGTEQTDPLGTQASPELPDLYIGGSIEGRETLRLPYTAPRITIATESWHGHIRDVQLRTVLDTARYRTGWATPLKLGVLDPSSTHAWMLNEGAGWLFANSINSTYAAESRIREFYPLASGLRQEEGRRYSAVNFRDSMIITNGAARPHRIQFFGYDKVEPWRVRQLGVEPPVNVDVELVATVTAGSTIPAGSYGVWCSFVTEDGQESDAASCGQLTTAAVGSLIIAVANLPRSSDPQVVGRRIYASPVGGGQAIYNRDVLDNDSRDADAIIFGATGEAVPVGDNLPAPRARHVAVAGGALVLADLPDEPAGQNGFAISSLSDISLFTAASFVILDSEDGRPITGIAHNLGSVFFSKRDSVWQLNVGSIVSSQQLDASVRLVQRSDGIGGGTAAANNLLYGAGDRGVFVFDNTNLQVLSNDIEPTWRLGVDRSDLGLYSMRGAFWRGYSQYWLSVRRIGQSSNDTVYVLDMATGQWTELRVRDHSWMGMVEVVPGQPTVAFGTNDGKVLAYNEDAQIEGVDGAANSRGATTTSATAGLSGTSTSLTVAGANFPTDLSGLRGVEVAITYNTSLSTTRRVVRNTSDTLYWEEAIPGWLSYQQVVTGPYEAYWTNPWWADKQLGHSQRLQSVTAEFLPQPGTLQVDIAALAVSEAAQKAFPALYERMSVPMQRGFTQRELVPRSHANGEYHRLRFGTYGINDRFALIGYKTTTSLSPAGSPTGRS